MCVITNVTRYIQILVFLSLNVYVQMKKFKIDPDSFLCPRCCARCSSYFSSGDSATFRLCLQCSLKCSKSPVCLLDVMIPARFISSALDIACLNCFYRIFEKLVIKVRYSLKMDVKLEIDKLY